MTLEPELRLVRSALLYADRVELISPGAALLETLTPLLSVNEADPWSGLKSLPDETLRRMGVEEPLAAARYAFRHYSRLPVSDPMRLAAQAQVSPVIADGIGIARGALEQAHAPDLELAFASGVVDVDSTGFVLEDSTECHIAWYRDRLLAALGGASHTLLLDDETTQFLREEHPERTLSPVADTRAKRSYTGTRLIERLPTFPDAPMADVLEVREELSDGRTKYRNAIRNLTAKLESTALDNTLASEVEELWQDEVRPQLIGMRETVGVSRLARGTGRRLVGDGKELLTSGATIAIAVQSLPTLMHLMPTTAAVAGATAKVLVAATSEALQSRAQVRRHDLVYLLDIHRRLDGRQL